MFIGHLPAGYLLTRFIQKAFNTQKYLWVGLVASVLPDIDMLYFYFVDDQQTLHHQYFTHVPLLWIALWIIVALVAMFLQKRAALIIATIFFANLILHFALDSIVGGISWLAPFSTVTTTLFTVPATHNFWVWSFVFHGTFLLEIMLIVSAGIVLNQTYKNQKPPR